MFKERKSFFDRLAGIVNEDDERYDEEEQEELEVEDDREEGRKGGETKGENWMQEEADEAELAVDVYQKPSEIVVQTMVAGVKPEDLDVTITREMVTVKGKRTRPKAAAENEYFYEELYWGSFSRTIMLPEEIDVEEAEAISQNGLLTLRLPKIDKKKSQRLRIKNG